MDRAEAIKHFEYGIIHDIFSEPVTSYARMAVDALREQEQSNEPLTWEELRKMDGEPVWVVWPDGRIASQWWIVGSLAWYMMEFFEEHSAMVYGTDWIAYRKPPKEGAEG